MIMRRLLLLLLTAMILNVSCDNLTKSKSEDTEESDSKSKKKKKKAADEEDEDVAADDENTDDEETSNDDSRSRNNDDEEDSRDASWTRSEQNEFMENCVENTGLSKAKSEEYCDCMLKKLQSRYPKATDMNRASDLKGEINEMAPGCLE